MFKRPASQREAEKLVEELAPRKGWPYVLALRELNGWLSGFYPKGLEEEWFTSGAGCSGTSTGSR